jgi:hypothetical protein
VNHRTTRAREERDKLRLALTTFALQLDAFEAWRYCAPSRAVV